MKGLWKVLKGNESKYKHLSDSGDLNINTRDIFLPLVIILYVQKVLFQ